MKFIYIILFSVCSLINVQSQKWDYNWLFGYFYDGLPQDGNWGIDNLNFNTKDGNPVVNNKSTIQNDFDYYGSMISDREGRFLFSYDGTFVEDYIGRIPNNKAVCPDDDCRFFPQSTLILPNLIFDSIYYIFNLHDERIGNEWVCNVFSYSSLHELPNETGIRLDLAKKDLSKKLFQVGDASSCRHANGRDWWIIAPGFNNNIYYFFILTDKLAYFSHTQAIGEKRIDGPGFCCFSPNGEYYAMATKRDSGYDTGALLYFQHFDRSTGMFSNQQVFEIDTSMSVSAGCAFSPDNQILYVCSNHYLYQYPLQNGKLNNRIEIAMYDGFESHLFGINYGVTTFGQLQNGPDGRIYLNSDQVQTKHLHVINEPNKIGLACDFQQHSLPLKSVKITMPYFPNYRLGPIDGSISDSLGINNMPYCWWRYQQDTLDHRHFKFTDASAYEVEEWYWDFGDGITSRDTSPLNTYSKNGVYDVCLIVKNKNGADTLCRTLYIGVVSNSDQNKNIDFQLFPNPCTSFLIINVNDYLPSKMLMTIYDIQGKEVLHKRLYQGSNVIDLELMNAGVYIVEIKERGIVVKGEKLVKM
ncbi:MAG: T9SS type A sorting domain-containing protein [Saprospiraceae bacterium]|nr:T9SS type A sorting domain-containing protein [Saprospiraceae bacterium]